MIDHFLAIGDWLLAIGDWRLAIGDWRLDMGDYLGFSHLAGAFGIDNLLGLR